MEKLQGKKEYLAFISYKREDVEWAEWLQNKLEFYKLPTYVMKENPALPEKLRPIFRDVTDLEPGFLSDKIKEALEKSRFLIVICSPKAAKSEWVEKEIQEFIKLGKFANIIPFIVDGVANAKNLQDECLPLAIRNLKNEKELLGANVNELNRDYAVVKVVAAMLGLGIDRLWQRYLRAEEKEKQELIDRQNRLLRLQSRYIATVAETLTKDGDAYLARLLLLDVLPQNLEYPDRPYVVEAERALRKSYSHDGFIIRHKGEVCSISISPNSNRIASSSINETTVNLWDMDSGALVNVLQGHTDWVNCVAYSPNGRLIASGAFDNSVKLWDADTGVLLKTFKHTDSIRSVSFSFDSEHLLSSSEDGHTIVWHLYEDQWDVLDYRRGGVWHSLFSPTEANILLVYGNLIIYKDAVSGTVLRIFEHNNTVCSVAFNFDGSVIASISKDEDIKIWDIHTGRLLKTIEHVGCVKSISFNSDGCIVATASEERIELWDIETGLLIKTLYGHKSRVSSVLFDYNNNSIVSASDDRTIRIWREKTNALLGCIRKRKEKIVSAEFSSDGNMIISSSNTIDIWDTKNLRLLKSFERHIEHYGFATFSPDGKMIAMGGLDNTIRLYDAKSGNLLRILKGHKWLPRSVAFSSDGRLLISGSSIDQKILVWETQSGNLLKIFHVQCNVLLASFTKQDSQVVFLTDGESSGGFFIDDRFSAVFIGRGEIDTCNILKEIKLPSENPTAEGFSSDGNMLALGYFDGLVKLWDTRTGELLNTINSHLSKVTFLSFNKNANLIVTANERTIKVWNVNDGTLVHIIENGHNDLIRSVRFNEGGDKIVSVSHDKTIKIWEFLSLQGLIDKTREQLKNRQLTNEERYKYNLD